jgi:hypothetical protein
MTSFLHKHHRLLFYSTWLILALAQAASTELIADEAYYWVYSKYLDWGYFDHPPLIAVLIKAGYSIFKSELGVRLICALLSTMTILITESLTSKKNPFLFYSIVLSIAVLQITGFLAVPDTPLLFFTAVFFYCYRKFLHSPNWLNTVLLAASITLLFYTKYHGLLIVVFTFLSNIKLLARRQGWFVILLVILVYAPHLLWQWGHDWVSFRYHLLESNVSAYKISYTTDYLLGQLLLAGPLAGFILLPAAFLYKTKDETEKALKFTLVGIYGIFLLSSFRGKVEANWTMPALIPLVILSHQFIIDKISWNKPVRIISFISLLLIVAGRLYLAVDIGPDNSTKLRFHNNKSSVKAIVEKTGDTPVIFYNSYQRASLFWFYSGVPSHSHNWYGERRSNYNFWPTEENLLGHTVFIADVYGINSFSDSVQTKKGLVGLTKDSLYAAMGGITIVPKDTNLREPDENTVHISFTCKIKENYIKFIKSNPNINSGLYAAVFSGKNLLKEYDTGITLQKLAGEKGLFEVTISNLPKTAEFIRFGIKSKGYPITHNSDKIGLNFK